MSPDFDLFSSLRYDPVLLQSTANMDLWPLRNPKPSPFYMLPYHRDRMLQAAEHFGWRKAIEAIDGTEGFLNLLSRLEEAVKVKPIVPLGMKVTLSFDGEIEVAVRSVPHVQLENLLPTRIPPPLSASQTEVSPLTGGALTLGLEDTVYGEAKKGYEAFEIMQSMVRTTPSSYTSYKTTHRDMYDQARVRADISYGDKKEVLLISDTDGAVMEGSITSAFFWRNNEWTTPALVSGGQIGTTRRWLLDRELCIADVVYAHSLVNGEECWISNGLRGFIWGKVKL